MRKLNDYLRHAAECREMARTAQPQQREQLNSMASTWERLADVRRKQLERDGKSEEDE